MAYIEVWAAIIAIATALIGLIWKTAYTYGDLKHQIRRNYEDINRMGNSLRKEISQLQEDTQEDIKNENWWIKTSIYHIQEHLNRRDEYYPPSFKREDGQ